MSHHLPQWAQEMSPAYRGPTIAGTLALLAVVAVLLLALLSSSTSTGAAGPPSTVPACARHWPPTCQDAAGGR